MEPRRPMPEPTPHWPSGPTAADDPTPVESALAALKYGAMLAATVTITLLFLRYRGAGPGRMATPVLVLLAFVLPSLIAALRTAWVRHRRRPSGERPPGAA